MVTAGGVWREKVALNGDGGGFEGEETRVKAAERD